MFVGVICPPQRGKIMWHLKYQSRNKYRNIKTEYNGINYASKLEASYARDLDILKRAKEIKEWHRQVRISLDLNGYHICNYYVDFSIDHNDGTTEYIEIKGIVMEVWRLKWRLFEAIFQEKIQSGQVKITVIK